MKITWAELNDRIMRCRACPGLNIPRQTMSAPGAGSRTATVMVVGQSLHGYNSRTPKVQIPFIGPVEHLCTGKQMLYPALEKAGYTLNNGKLFVTNVVHCHPLNNRASRDREKRNCRIFLEYELRLVKPKIIVAVGRDAQEWFSLPRPGTAQWVSIEYPTTEPTWGKAVYVSAYHPGFVMRSELEHAKRNWVNQLARVITQAEELAGVRV